MQKHQQFKSDLYNANSIIQNQLCQLRMLDKKFSTMDGELRFQVSNNIRIGNNTRAKAIANELANVRRVQRTMQNMSLALEVIILRFATISQFATIMETIYPTIDIIKGIQKDISNVIPNANTTLVEMNSLTSEILAESNIKLDACKIQTPVDKDALSILNEIEGSLEEETKMKLPDIPTTVSINLRDKVAKQIVEEKRIMIEG
jgi:division protein CdvB (Snf7/Vps24/ESCRT-III family)